MEYKTHPSLSELQIWMKWIITDPRGVEQALKKSTPAEELVYQERYTEPSVSAKLAIKETPNLTERLSIYAEAYFLRLLDSLQDDFLVTEKILGQTTFRKLVADYLKAYPSQTHHIGELGKNFALFTQGSEWIEEYPYLLDVVQMEWLGIEAFYTSPSYSFDAQRLSELTEEDWQKVGFKINPSLKFLESFWSLDFFWQSRDSKKEFMDKVHKPYLHQQGYVLFQRGSSVQLEKINEAEKVLLKNLQSGTSLNQSLEWMSEKYPEINWSEEMGIIFNKWIQNQWIEGVLL